MFKLTIAIGIVALISVATPDLVMIGIFFIVPGIIMMLTPTVFVYLAAATGLRSILQLGTGVTGTIVAFLAAGLLGWLVAWPFQRMGVNEFVAAIEQDVDPGVALQLSGHIRVERGDVRHLRGDAARECDALCAALLLTPGVESVTVAKGKELKTVTCWRLVPKGNEPDTGLIPVSPADIFRHYPREDRALFRDLKAKSDALTAEWNLRLASRNTLVANATPPAPDMTIAIVAEREKLKPNVQRLEVRDRAGVPLLRRSLVRHAVVGVPFAIGFEARMHDPRFCIRRKRLSTGERHQEFNAITELIQHVQGLRCAPSEEAPREARQRLVAALDSSGESSPDLALARPWINALGYRFSSDDDKLLFRRIVADHRIRDVGGAMRNLYAKSAPIEYRPILVNRILAAETTAKDRKHFAFLLSKMPEGTFATLNEQEWRIFGDPTLRHDAAPFAERLADQGKPGVEPLLTILQQAITLPVWIEREPMVRAVRRGFARLGPDAAEALPVVRELFEQKRSPITSRSKDAFAWRITMARMGTPVDELPFPASINEQNRSKSQAEIARRVSEFDPNSDMSYGD